VKLNHLAAIYPVGKISVDRIDRRAEIKAFDDKV
jgi:hypothetical protein